MNIGYPQCNPMESFQLLIISYSGYFLLVVSLSKFAKQRFRRRVRACAMSAMSVRNKKISSNTEVT